MLAIGVGQAYRSLSNDVDKNRGNIKLGPLDWFSLDERGRKLCRYRHSALAAKRKKQMGSLGAYCILLSDATRAGNYKVNKPVMLQRCFIVIFEEEVALLLTQLAQFAKKAAKTQYFGDNVLFGCNVFLMTFSEEIILGEPVMRWAFLNIWWEITFKFMAHHSSALSNYSFIML